MMKTLLIKISALILVTTFFISTAIAVVDGGGDTDGFSILYRIFEFIRYILQRFLLRS
jgi:hypothetical protein